MVEPDRGFSSRSIRPRGFSLVETLAVAAVVGTLLILLLPTIQKWREDSRRTQCADNCRRQGLAVAAYESARRIFPPGSDAFSANPKSQPPRLHAWASFSLPFADDVGVGLKIDLDKPWNDPGGNREIARKTIGLYVCPSSIERYPGKQDYGAVVGTAVPLSTTGKLVDDWQHSGVLYATDDEAHREPARREAISDGLASTLLVAESVDRGHTGSDDADDFQTPIGPARWACGTSCVLQNSPVIDDPGGDSFRSTHVGGIQALFADGHVVFLGHDIEGDLLIGLCTKSGGDKVPEL